MKKKRLLSLAMAVAMVFGSATMMPKGAFTDSSTIISASAVKASTETSGECGENVTWVLNGSLLTISGTGDMYDYEPGQSPFYYYRAYISKVVIELGVTSVGACAFDFCQNLKSVTLPESIQNIGSSSFQFTALKEITIPNGVWRIGGGAFNCCTELLSISLP